MTDLEQLVRDNLRYEDGLLGLDPEALTRRARQRRLRRRLRSGTAFGVIGLAAFAGWTWTDLTSGDAGPEPGDRPNVGEVAPSITRLAPRDRVVTPDGAVVVSSPGEICVGNTHQEPYCLHGEDIELGNEHSLLAFWTQSPDDFVYAWLVPVDSSQASLQVGQAEPHQAALFRILGRRDVAVAVVTAANCWSTETPITLIAADDAGVVVHKRAVTEQATCP